ncbi:AlpA family phage regulatory protein [Burkholderia multivorans]|uniref:helix-turn-helix transcriptional regulator n=1 Tax=Burkholderia multivorans TaxID=87883 RepID=UPI001C2374F9|nr:AlpA family phage regulatory protein [Burkholderia multivorans]MBU9136679.1 AlpA family phage regulatory protein [Burkholderia multivorans]
MESEMEQLSQTSDALPLPGTEAYEKLPQFPKRSPLPFRRTIRRQELRQIVPLAETTIYEMERRGEFPRRFNLTPRCVVWDLAEVEAWIEQRKQARRGSVSKPDVHLRKTRPVRAGSSEE